MKKIILPFFVSLSIIFCVKDNRGFLEDLKISFSQRNIKLEKKIDSLEKLSAKLMEKIVCVEKESPIVILETSKTRNRELLIFHPFRLNVQFQHFRPSVDSNNFLCIPAAYTSKENQIVGLYIENGVVVNKLINNELTGVCIISNANI